jgi:hypothetical protein
MKPDDSICRPPQKPNPFVTIAFDDPANIVDFDRDMDVLQNSAADVRAETFGPEREAAARMAGKSIPREISERRKKEVAQEQAEQYLEKLSQYYGAEVLRFLKRLQPIEIIIIGLNCEGLSQDKIVAELQRRNMGRGKAFVNVTIRKFNGIKLGKRVPEAVITSQNAGKEYAEDAKTGAAIIKTVQTDTAPLPNQIVHADELPGLANAYRAAKPEEQAIMLREYGKDLKDYLKKKSHKIEDD